jgi:hypothetical protein
MVTPPRRVSGVEAIPQAPEARVGMTPDDIDAAARLARAEAEAVAVLARAEIDAEVVRASAEADAAAERARAELDAITVRRAADADREEAARVLDEARAHADAMVSHAADVRRRAEQETLDRLRATRADLHDAIERLSEMTEPVLDLTDGTVELADALDLVGADVVALSGPITLVESPFVDDAQAQADSDPIDAMVRSAIERAADSASAEGRSQPWSSEQPSRRGGHEARGPQGALFPPQV